MYILQIRTGENRTIVLALNVVNQFWGTIDQLIFEKKNKKKKKKKKKQLYGKCW